jgi:excisionase family DNA binding protein
MVLTREIEALVVGLTAMVEQAVERAIERRLPVNESPVPSNGDVLVGVHDAAKRLGLARATIYKMAARVELASVKIGSRLRFRVSDLNDFAEKHRRSPELVARLAAGSRPKR